MGQTRRNTQDIQLSSSVGLMYYFHLLFFRLPIKNDTLTVAATLDNRDTGKSPAVGDISNYFADKGRRISRAETAEHRSQSRPAFLRVISPRDNRILSICLEGEETGYRSRGIFFEETFQTGNPKGIQVEILRVRAIIALVSFSNDCFDRSND